MFQNKFLIFFIALLFSSFFFNGIFLGQNFFIDEDPFSMMRYSSTSINNNGWNANALFGVTTLYSDPGTTHYYSLFSIIESFLNKINFYDEEIFFNSSVIVMYSLSVTSIFYFLKYFTPQSNNLIALILSFLFLFGSSRYDLQFQRHWLVIGFGFPAYIMCLNEYFLTNKKKYLFNTTLIFFIVLHFGSIPALQNVLIAGFLFLIVKFFSEKKLYIKEYLKINFFSLTVLLLLSSWIWYPMISEIIQTQYMRAESYSNFDYINKDFLTNVLKKVFWILFGPITPLNLTLPIGDVNISTGQYSNINFIFNFIFLLFMYQIKNNKTKEIYFFLLSYIALIIINLAFPIIQSFLIDLIGTYPIEKVSQEIFILQICVMNMVLNSDFKDNLNLILKKTIIKIYLIILFIITLIPFFINIVNILNFSFKDTINNFLVFLQPNIYNLPNDIVRKVLVEVYKRYEMSLDFNSLLYFFLSILIIYIIINFKKNIFFQNKIFFSFVILFTHYFLSAHFYPLSSSERLWDKEKISEFNAIDRFFTVEISKRNELLDGQYEIFEEWIDNNPLTDPYYGYRESPGINFSGLTSFYPKNEGEMIIKNSDISKLRSFVKGKINFLESTLFKNSSIKYIITNNEIEKPIYQLSLIEKYKNKFIYVYEPALPIYYVANNLKYTDYNKFKQIINGTIFLKNKKYSFKESDFNSKKNNINLIKYKNNEFIFNNDSKKADILFINNSFHKNWSLVSSKYNTKSFECNYFKNCFIIKPGEYDFKIIFKKELNYGLYLSALTMLIFFYFFLRFRPNTYRD